MTIGVAFVAVRGVGASVLAANLIWRRRLAAAIRGIPRAAVIAGSPQLAPLLAIDPGRGARARALLCLRSRCRGWIVGDWIRSLSATPHRRSRDSAPGPLGRGRISAGLLLIPARGPWPPCHRRDRPLSGTQGLFCAVAADRAADRLRQIEVARRARRGFGWHRGAARIARSRV